MSTLLARLIARDTFIAKDFLRSGNDFTFGQKTGGATLRFAYRIPRVMPGIRRKSGKD
jgi:hypothetical protein